MKKLSFEKWESKYYDVPFIKPNFQLLEDMGVDTYTVNCSQDTSDGKTKYVRVFHYGGWYEILENGNHYLLLGNHDWLGKDEETIKTIKKELYDWASEELTDFGELEEYKSRSGCELEDVTDEFYNEKGELKQ